MEWPELFRRKEEFIGRYIEQREVNSIWIFQGQIQDIQITPNSIRIITASIIYTENGKDWRWFARNQTVFLTIVFDVPESPHLREEDGKVLYSNNLNTWVILPKDEHIA